MNKNAALCQQTTLWRKNNKQLHMEIWTQKETNNLFSSHRDGIGLKIWFDFFYYLSEWTIDFEKCSESMSKNRKICFLTDGWIPKFFFSVHYHLRLNTVVWTKRKSAEHAEKNQQQTASPFFFCFCCHFNSALLYVNFLRHSLFRMTVSR